MHNVVFTEKSIKDIGKIDLENQNRIILKLKEFPWKSFSKKYRKL